MKISNSVNNTEIIWVVFFKNSRQMLLTYVQPSEEIGYKFSSIQQNDFLHLPHHEKQGKIVAVAVQVGRGTSSWEETSSGNFFKLLPLKHFSPVKVKPSSLLT